MPVRCHPPVRRAAGAARESTARLRPAARGREAALAGVRLSRSPRAVRLAVAALLVAGAALVFGGVADRWVGAETPGRRIAAQGSTALRGRPSETTLVRTDGLAQAVTNRINRVRATHGLRSLAVSARLVGAATRHASSMAAHGYIRHDLWTPTRPLTWTPFSAWVRWHYPGPGYSSWRAGENLAFGSPDITADEVVRRWLASSAHRANLLAAGWREVGVGAVHVTNAGGQFVALGDVTLVAAEFGRRS